LSDTDIPSISENDATVRKRPSPWVMLITMLLIISGLIVSSALLLDYAADLYAQDEHADASPFDLDGLIEQGRKWSKQEKHENLPDASAPQEKEEHDSAVKRFFSGTDNETVRWPKLKLTGFGTSSDAEGAFAIINGRQVLVNTSIDEVKLIEVHTHGAVVEYKGERKILTLDPGR
jgi:hypothetical protein